MIINKPSLVLIEQITLIIANSIKYYNQRIKRKKQEENKNKGQIYHQRAQ